MSDLTEGQHKIEEATNFEAVSISAPYLLSNPYCFNSCAEELRAADWQSNYQIEKWGAWEGEHGVCDSGDGLEGAGRKT